MIDGAIACDSQQPRSECSTAWLKGLDAVPDSQKCFLHQIFRDSRVSHNTEHHRISQPAEAVVEILHRLRIAALQTAHQIFVVVSAEFKSEDETWKHHAIKNFCGARIDEDSANAACQERWTDSDVASGPASKSRSALMFEAHSTIADTLRAVFRMMNHTMCSVAISVPRCCCHRHFLLDFFLQ